MELTAELEGARQKLEDGSPPARRSTTRGWQAPTTSTHGDVVTPVEIWVVEDGAIASTGRFETP